MTEAYLIQVYSVWRLRCPGFEAGTVAQVSLDEPEISTSRLKVEGLLLQRWRSSFQTKNLRGFFSI